MIKQFLESLEDPERPLMAPNYWILKRLGFLLPKHKLGKLGYILIHEIVTFFVISQYIELYVIRSNLDQVLTNLKISLISVVCIFKVNSFFFWQKSWREIFEYINDADKFERNHRNTAKGQIIDSYTKYCRRLTYFYWVLTFITFWTTVAQPLMIYLTSPIFREKVRNGTEDFPHIFSSWMPFDKNHAPGCWITVAWHIFACAYGALVMASYDSSIVVIIVFFGGKLDLLRERCKEMLGVNGVGISDEDAATVVRELHNIHVMLIKYSRLFNSMLSPVMFLYVVMCSLLICVGAYHFTSATNTTQKLLTAEFLIFAIAQLFVYCWHSNDVIVKNEKVSSGPYESQWWTATLQQRKDVIILSGQLRINHIFSAGPFVNLTLATFISILKGAYSYYTLLRK